MPAKAKTAKPGFRCTECGWTTIKWVGRCGECQEWGTVVDAAAPSGPSTKAGDVVNAAVPIGDVAATASTRTSTGLDEVDRVLGGGLVPGAVVLVAGEPGVGKSTLLLDVAARTARQDRKVLYLSGEESAAQVRLRAERIGALEEHLLLASESNLATVLGHIESQAPALVIVDSIQTLESNHVDGTPGGVSQMREAASAIVHTAKRLNIPTVLVGHVTKDGSVAGPRLVEHLVDVVCQFEGDDHSALRLLRTTKNRYGSVDEVGCFQLTDGGIEAVLDPAGIFLSAGEPVAGTCPTITIDGKRPLPAEIQALVTSSALANPRRATSGIDSSRVAMILAVLHRRAGLAVASDDVYVSTVGGARVIEPAADLALALALASSRKDVALKPGLVVVGEVALSGVIRPVRAIDQRVAEAARLGFKEAIVPAGSTIKTAGIRVHQVQTLAEAVAAAIPVSR